MKTTVSQNGQIDLPEEFRQQDGVTPGQRFDVQRIGTGCYLLHRESPVSPPGESSSTLAWLRACPASDWFVPIPSESTDEL
jgi:bifunctional DNA-binding transcriptional regulator/antitoxin component of YhaV-PrlF toxin-antitoxin module